MLNNLLYIIFILMVMQQGHRILHICLFNFVSFCGGR